MLRKNNVGYQLDRRPHSTHRKWLNRRDRITRCLERKWRSTRSQSDRQHYVNPCGVVIHLIGSLKSEHYTNIVNQHLSDQKVPFKTVNKLLQKSPVRRYSASHNNTILANSCADYFTEKIEKIHESLSLREDKVSGPPTLNRNLLFKAQKLSVRLKTLR